MTRRSCGPTSLCSALRSCVSPTTTSACRARPRRASHPLHLTPASPRLFFLRCMKSLRSGLSTSAPRDRSASPACEQKLLMHAGNHAKDLRGELGDPLLDAPRRPPRAAAGDGLDVIISCLCLGADKGGGGGGRAGGGAECSDHRGRHGAGRGAAPQGLTGKSQPGAQPARSPSIARPDCRSGGVVKRKMNVTGSTSAAIKNADPHSIQS